MKLGLGIPAFAQTDCNVFGLSCATKLTPLQGFMVCPFGRRWALPIANGLCPYRAIGLSYSPVRAQAISIGQSPMLRGTQKLSSPVGAKSNKSSSKSYWMHLLVQRPSKISSIFVCAKNAPKLQFQGQVRSFESIVSAPWWPTAIHLHAKPRNTGRQAHLIDRRSIASLHRLAARFCLACHTLQSRSFHRPRHSPRLATCPSSDWARPAPAVLGR